MNKGFHLYLSNEKTTTPMGRRQKRGRTGKKTCKPVGREEYHEKAPTLLAGKKPIKTNKNPS
jgi:hypothetical protein